MSDRCDLTNASRPARRNRPRCVCEGCGRVAAWKPGAVCARCRVQSIRERLQQPTVPAPPRMVDVAALERVHARWLARQPEDHPFRVAAKGGGA